MNIYINAKPKTPQHVLRYAHKSYTNLLTSNHNEPYIYLDEEDKQALYLGFDKPLDSGLTSMLFTIKENYNSNYLTKWSYFTQEEIWEDLTVEDNTSSFTKSGVCSFSVPSNQQALSKFGQTLYWLKITFNSLSQNSLEDITFNAIHLNTIMATQGISIKKKLLGSSDGSALQEFKIENTPVMQVEIWVRESNIPLNTEYYTDEFEEGYWVQWSEVKAFDSNTNNKRVYIVDSHSGKVIFSDINTGHIPPMGKNNILTSYKIGAGVKGNINKHHIDKLASSIAYIDKITNYESAMGGADEQSIESLINAAPKRIRHKNRAVTYDDFEALSYEASSNIAKVKISSQAGLVQLFILPYSEVKKPLPTETLKTLLKDYISTRTSATIAIEVSEPHYVNINISLNIVVDNWNLASTLKNSVQVKIDAFLHPLKGGPTSKGWNFGEVPTLSHIFNLLNTVDGIAYFKEAEISMDNQVLYDLDGQKHINLDKDIMIYSGEHNINVELRSRT